MTHMKVRRTASVKVVTGSRIPLLNDSVLGHNSAADQDIFTKFSVYVENGALKRVELSKYTSFSNPKWRSAAKSNQLNRCNLAADGPIWRNFAR